MYSKSGMIVLFCVLHFPLFAQTQDLDGDGVPDATDQCCNTPKGISVDKDGRPVGDLDGDCDVDHFDIKIIVKNKTGRGSFIGLCPQHCRESSECSEDEYCKKEMGNCDGIGYCEGRTGGCPTILMPTMCGCDNMNTDKCWSTVKGVNIAYEGACVCKMDDECGPLSRCVPPIGTCIGEKRCRFFPCLDGTCLEVECPPDCEDIVCGCDGETYGNKNTALAHGTSVRYEGGCRGGCKRNLHCAEDEFCDKAFDDCNGWGVCNTRPISCPDDYAPVCSCDCQSYDNSCEAAANGANVSHRGLFCSP